jgi:hypothetical protein
MVLGSRIKHLWVLGSIGCLLAPEGYWIEPDGISTLCEVSVFYKELARTGCHQMVLGRRIKHLLEVAFD